MVWMYHSIATYDEDPFEVTMTPARFERQLRWLRDQRLQGVSMAELLASSARDRSKRLVGLTFDDGYRDFATTALPILQRYGFTATVFVLAGRLGGQNEWSRPGPSKALLTADEIRQVASAGMEIGSHGLMHVRLPGVDQSALAAETRHSRTILSELIQRDVTGFCYPWGEVDAEVVKSVRAAGYDYACAVKPGSDIGQYAIPRTLVHEGDSAWRLHAKRAVSTLTVGNRWGVRHYRGGERCAL
ncbi:polysaccharide deacetylase [Mycolicibacterium iranicum]|nr:polysaccharide deacetylase [Mycolicibacterium iranicum]